MALKDVKRFGLSLQRGCTAPEHMEEEGLGSSELIAWVYVESSH